VPGIRESCPDSDNCCNNPLRALKMPNQDRTYFTPTEVAAHNTPVWLLALSFKNKFYTRTEISDLLSQYDDCWVSFLGRVYNLTPLIRENPGCELSQVLHNLFVLIVFVFEGRRAISTFGRFSRQGYFTLVRCEVTRYKEMGEFIYRIRRILHTNGQICTYTPLRSFR
jgi:hypothetical protein